MSSHFNFLHGQGWNDELDPFTLMLGPGLDFSCNGTSDDFLIAADVLDTKSKLPQGIAIPPQSGHSPAPNLHSCHEKYLFMWFHFVDLGMCWSKVHESFGMRFPLEEMRKNSMSASLSSFKRRWVKRGYSSKPLDMQAGMWKTTRMYFDWMDGHEGVVPGMFSPAMSQAAR